MAKTKIEIKQKNDYDSYYETIATFEIEGTFSVVSSDNNIKIEMSSVDERYSY